MNLKHCIYVFRKKQQLSIAKIKQLKHKYKQYLLQYFVFERFRRSSQGIYLNELYNIRSSNLNTTKRLLFSLNPGL